MSKNLLPGKLCCKLARLLFLKKVLSYSPEHKLKKTFSLIPVVELTTAYHVFPRTFHTWALLRIEKIGSLSSDVFERRPSTGSEPFSLLISLDATVFILPSVLILIETICAKIYLKSRLKSAKRPLPVDVRRSKTSLLKLPNIVLEVLLVLEFYGRLFKWSLS